MKDNKINIDFMLSKEIEEQLIKVAKGIDFKTHEFLIEIEDEYFGKILYTKNKQLIKYTSLPFTLKKLDYNPLKDLWNINCKKCETTTHILNVPWGNLNPKIFVIGSTPSGMRKYPPYRCLSFKNSGAYIRNTLSKLNLNSYCWYTNIVKCCLTGGRKFIREEIKNCSFYLRKELRILKPKFLILLGNDVEFAIDRFYSDLKISKIKVYHPGYFIRRNKSMQDYYEYLKEKLKCIKNMISI